MAKMFCISCGREELERGKCTYCNDGAFRTRLSRALKEIKDGNDASIAIDFSKLSDEAKVKFKQDNHNKLGANLRMAIHQEIALQPGRLKFPNL